MPDSSGSDEILRLRQAVDASREIIFLTDADGVITFINPEFTRVYGYTAADVVGRTTPRILKSGVVPPARYDSFWASLVNEGVAHLDVMNRAKDGRLVAIEGSASAVRDDGGALVGYAAIQRDLTERRHLEEDLRQAQKMETIGRLAGGIAHDFNNLLTAILGYGELLRERVHHDPELDGDLAEILKAAERASSLTRQLLAFSRRQALKPEIVNLNAVVREVEKMLRRVMGEDVELRTTLPSSLGAVSADPAQMGQVLLNLAVNARDAMPRGGTLTIETAERTMVPEEPPAVPDMIPGRYVCLTVHDTGSGMTPEVLAHVFEPFFTTKEAGKGTGLGLATVYGIVKQSGGYTTVTSRPGEGAAFTIYLPRVEVADEAAQAAPRPAAAARGGETILLVEDEPSTRALVRRVLEHRKYTVLEAGTGPEAIGVAGSHGGPIHLLLTDIVMPGMSGVDLAQHIVGTRPGVRVMYMSGFSVHTHFGRVSPSICFVQKPFSPGVLAAAVRACLEAPEPDVHA